MSKNQRKYPFDRYHVNFKYNYYDEKAPEIIRHFKEEGELTPESKIKITEIGDILKVTWKRPYFSEKFDLLRIHPTDGFLEFLDKFIEKKRWLNPGWETDYSTILTACKICAQDQRKFKELVRKAKSLDEFKIASAFRD